MENKETKKSSFFKGARGN